MDLNKQLAANLTLRRQQHLYRQRRILESPQQAQLTLDGKEYLAFCSNDYLGLANHPDVVAAFKHAVDRYGVGSGASHLVCGHSEEHHRLEEELAVFTGRERVLLFSTGYMANIGTINALLGKNDFIFEDKLNHASLLDAGLSCGARFQRFHHNNMDDLERRLSTAKGGRKLIVVDGVFSMDGDYAPLTELSALAEKYDASLMVDDAHGFGCIGQQGQGCTEFFDLNATELPILMCTLGKAVGTFGAFVAGSEALIETLIQHARTYIYTTALPPAVAAATRASLKVIQQEAWRRERLQMLIKRFRCGAEQLGLSLMESQTAIQPLLIGDAQRAMQISTALADKGVLISAIRPPTVPVDTARLRITLSAAHSEQDIDQLLLVLEEVL